MAELLIAAGVEAALAGTIATVVQVGVVAASIAVSQSQQRRAKRRAIDEYNRSLRDQMVTLKGGVNPRPLLYGRTCVGGQLIYAETTGSRKENLLMVIALAHGEVDAIETVYFNDIALTLDGSGSVTNAPYYLSGQDPYVHQVAVPGAPYQVTLPHTPTAIRGIQDGASNVVWGGGDSGSPPLLNAGTDYTVAGNVVTFASTFAGHTVQITYEYAVSASYAWVGRYTGATGQDLSSTMAALGAPSWTSADKCQDMAALIVRLTYAENIWEAGIPNIKAVVRGRKCYDPRTSTTVWTSNAALCARDYLTFQYGVNAASGRIDDTATIAAANICDEDVQLTATPTYQDRYAFDGAVSTGDDRLSNLELFAQSMGGSINYSQGKWRIRAGAYTAPALTLDENKLSGAGAVRIVPFNTRRDLINGAKGTYFNADGGWIEDQFPVWSSATFITEDGGAPLTTSLTLPQVTDVSRAQRLAKIAVYRAREQLTLQVACNFSTYTWQVGDMVSVTLARYGFSAKPFRIQQRGFSVEGGMSFLLREEPNGIYDWNLGEASILTGAANTTLPSPGTVAAPTITGITSAQWLYKAGDGTFVARIRVAVTPPDDEYVQRGGKLQLHYRRGDWTDDWSLIEADGSATEIWIDPAFDSQNYLIRVRAKNSAGFVSLWTPMWAHTCIGRVGVITNLLLNSNFTQDLGYGSSGYPDARALRHWTAFSHLGTFQYGRNYAYWNLGNGGAWTQEGTPTASGFALLYQRIPIQAGVALEASVYVSVHRCQVAFYLRWVDAGLGYLSDAMGGPDAVDADTGVIGDPHTPQTEARLWRTGTAPANTAYAEILLIKSPTTSGQSESFAFWSQALACLAPDGVTRETATPWLDDSINTIDGGILTPGSVTDVTDSRPANSSTGWVNNNPALTPNFTHSPATVTYTNTTPASVFVVVTYSCLASWGNTGLQAGGVRLKTVLNGVTTVPTGVDIFFTNEGTPTRALFAGTFSVIVPAGQALSAAVEFFGARFAPGTTSTTIYWKDTQLNLQGIRK